MKVRFLLIVVVVLFATGILTTQSYAKIDPKSITGLWLFDEGNGDVAKDSSGNKIDGTITKPKWVDGRKKPSKALQLDGSSSYIMVHIGAPPQSISIAAWIFPTDGGVVFAENGQQALDGGWYDSHMEILSSGEFKVGFWTGAEQGISLGKFPLNNWYYFVMTYDKDNGNTIKGYVNAELIESGKLVKLYPGDLWYGIGGKTATNLGDGSFFDGIIDEAAVYNVALSAADIKLNFQTANAVYSSDKMATTWASIKAQ